MDETKKLGIDEKLNRLLKNVTDDYFAKDEVDEEIEDEDYVSEDEIADANDDEEIVYDFNETEPEEEVEAEEEIEEDEELEKAEEDEIAEDEEIESEAEVEEEVEAEEEPVEEEEDDVEEVEYDDLLGRVRDDLGLDEINGRLDDLTANLSKVVDLLEINTDNANEAVEKNQELEKSIKLLTKKLSKNENLRKSVKNAQVFNKYEEEKKTYKDLSKSQRAEILASELLAGRKGVTAVDVSKAEQGAPLSDECIAIIEKHL
ncbi:hypothetical protein [uncultured Anaerococcus sp.]|uniref:hypothetical protein n=1 Tax=uncultured Anaerococcus sp. TaxID=293428 RepID=UPI00288BB336|nr:hypothetical protein [uncultured Anaerococcus sp.]